MYHGNKIHCIIPARYQSSRLPGKVLAKIGDKSVLEHTYERAFQCPYIDSIFIATDFDIVSDEAIRFCPYVYTVNHPFLNGTERASWLADQPELSDADYIIILQADAPFINEKLLNNFIKQSILHEHAITTCSIPLADAELTDRKSVKAYSKDEGDFIFEHMKYMSRSIIFPGLMASKHIGIYCYRAPLLKQFRHWIESQNAYTESIELLRAIDSGYDVHNYIAFAGEYNAYPQIDTPEDLRFARELYKNGHPI